MKLFRLALLTSTLVISLSAVCLSQTPSVHATGLLRPNKIIKAPANSLIVAEAGAAMPNTGRLSIVDRTSGMRHTLIDGLPSAVSFLGSPVGDPDGPSGILLRGNTLFVTIGVGNAVIPAGPGGLELPNPNPPASPIFNSVLEITLPGGYATLASPFHMTLADQDDLDSGDIVTISNVEGRSITVRLVADLPDWRPDPRPMNPDNVKASHLYGVEIFQKSLYVADAGHNNLKEINRYTGDFEVFTVFAPIPNPTMTGPPFIEAVPDNIHRFGNQLLVPLLTGFPFVPGLSSIQRVALKTGDTETFLPALTHAIDIIKAGDEDDEEIIDEKSDKDAPEARMLTTGKAGLKAGLGPIAKTVVSSDLTPGDGNSFYTLEFSLNFLAGGNGRLRYYYSPTSMPENLLTNLVTPTSMTRDDDTGNLFITNIGPGTVTKVTFP